MMRGHVGTARSSSLVASSEGHDISRLVESGTTTWTLSRHRIFIGGARRAPIFLSFGRDVERSGLLDRPLNLSFIGRRGGFVEELHDCGLIKPRSSRDRAAIVDLSLLKQSHDLDARFQLKIARETSTIEA